MVSHKAEVMQIETGKLYKNKTWDYLIPCLKAYEPELLIKVNSLFKLAVGLFDMLLQGSEHDGKRYLFLLFDKQVRPELFYMFIDWLQLKDYYVLDYAWDDVVTGSKHMVVIKFPEKYASAYDKFLIGKYSEMFSTEDVHLLFPEENLRKQVLLKSPEAMPHLQQRVLKEFNTTIDKTDIIENGMELELPLLKHEELFNYMKTINGKGI